MQPQVRGRRAGGVARQDPVRVGLGVEQRAWGELVVGVGVAEHELTGGDGPAGRVPAGQAGQPRLGQAVDEPERLPAPQLVRGQVRDDVERAGGRREQRAAPLAQDRGGRGVEQQHQVDRRRVRAAPGPPLGGGRADVAEQPPAVVGGHALDERRGERADHVVGQPDRDQPGRGERDVERVLAAEIRSGAAAPGEARGGRVEAGSVAVEPGRHLGDPVAEERPGRRRVAHRAERGRPRAAAGRSRGRPGPARPRRPGWARAGLTTRESHRRAPSSVSSPGTPSRRAELSSTLRADSVGYALNQTLGSWWLRR